MNNIIGDYKILVRRSAPSRALMMKLYKHTEDKVQDIKQRFENLPDCDWVAVFRNVEMTDCDTWCGCTICEMKEQIDKGLPTAIEDTQSDIDRYEAMIVQCDSVMADNPFNEKLCRDIERFIDILENEITCLQLHIRLLKGEQI